MAVCDNLGCLDCRSSAVRHTVERRDRMAKKKTKRVKTDLDGLEMASLSLGCRGAAINHYMRRKGCDRAIALKAVKQYEKSMGRGR